MSRVSISTILCLCQLTGMHAFHVVHQSATWTEAEQYCQQNFDAHLVTITNATTNSDIAAALTDPAWIGCHDRDNEGEFSWISGQSMTYTAWSANEPKNDSGDEDCCTINSPLVLTWGAWPCTQSVSAFVCDGPESTVTTLAYTLEPDLNGLGGSEDTFYSLNVEVLFIAFVAVIVVIFIVVCIRKRLREPEKKQKVRKAIEYGAAKEKTFTSSSTTHDQEVAEDDKSDKPAVITIDIVDRIAQRESQGNVIHEETETI